MSASPALPSTQHPSLPFSMGPAAAPTPVLTLPPPPSVAPPQQPAPAPAAQTQQQPQPRVRQRKKPAPAIEPDTLYRGASSSSILSHGAGTVPHSSTAQGGTGSKRALALDGSSQPASEPRKRKRVADSTSTSQSHGPNASLHASPYAVSASAVSHSHSGGGGGGLSRAGGRHVSAVGMADRNASGSNQAADGGGDGGQSFFDFSTLPTPALYQYIAQYGLEPAIYPRPLTSDDPPPPGALLDPSRMGHRAPTPPPLLPPPAPRRNKRAKTPSGGSATNDGGSHRRRSMRLIEEQHGGGGIGIGIGIGIGTGVEQVPVLADVREVHRALAALAQKHFQESAPVREVETLAAFMGAVKARGNPARRFKVV